jgi:hypothetical protein
MRFSVIPPKTLSDSRDLSACTAESALKRVTVRFKRPCLNICLPCLVLDGVYRRSGTSRQIAAVERIARTSQLV